MRLGWIFLVCWWLSGALGQRVAVVGDWGADSPHRPQVMQVMRLEHQRQPLAALFTLGDNFYPAGKVVPEFVAELPPVRVYPAFGNHDLSHIEQQMSLWKVERYYHVALGSVDFFILDSEAFMPAQKTWLAQQLARAQQPWKVVILHRPLYSSGLHGGSRSLREALEPLLKTYKVDLVLSGHEHNYERLTLPTYTQIVSGGGGAYLRGFLLAKPQSVVRASVAHFLLLEASPTRLEVRAVDTQQQTIDRWQLGR